MQYGYQAGANDYIVKLIKPKVLISKVNALMNLTQQVEEKNKILKIGHLIIDRDNFKVTKGDEKPYYLKRNLIC